MTTRLKVLHVIDTVDPKTGGPVQAMLQFIQCQGRDIESDVVTLDHNGETYVANFPVRIFGLGQKASRGSFRWSPKLRPWLEANSRNYDLIIIHGIWTFASIGTWSVIRKHNVPFFVFTHGMLDPWFKRTYPLKHLKKQLFWSLFLGRIFKASSAVIFTAEDELQSAKDVFFGFRTYPTAIVRLGVAVRPSEESGRLEGQFRGTLPVLKDRRYLLFLGRIHPKKGCDILVRGFAEFISRSQNEELDLVIAGPDPMNWKHELQSLAKELGIATRVHWPGMVSGEEKWSAFYGAEAFVLPSHQENFGIAVAEALSCGTPVLISDKINIWREIVGRHAGLAELDTVGGVIRLVQSWENMSSAEKREMRSNALRSQLLDFDAEINASKLSDLIVDACHKSGKSFARSLAHN